MTNFEKFVENNKSKLFAYAEQNTCYNEHGQAIISCKDTWRNEKIWDDYYEELTEKSLP